MAFSFVEMMLATPLQWSLTAESAEIYLPIAAEFEKKTAGLSRRIDDYPRFVEFSPGG